MSTAPELEPRADRPSAQQGRALAHSAPAPARGGYADGFEPLARRFAEHLQHGREIGAGLTVFHRGRCVVDLYGGVADRRSKRPWRRDSRVVLFSVSKGFAAMAMLLLHDRGRFDWDDPVAKYWPGFAAKGKGDISIRTLMNHRGGLLYLDEPLTLRQCTERSGRAAVLHALESQEPAWRGVQRQGYHAITFGMYVRELFERIAGEPLGPFLRRELFEPLGSDVYLGAPAALDAKVATIYPPPAPARVSKMLTSLLLYPQSTEARMARSVVRRNSMQKRAFLNPSIGRGGPEVYNEPFVRRATLAWASATASANGVARAYLPFASGGVHGGRRYLSEDTLTPVYRRQGWSEQDEVLMKPVGWSQGFLKEERHLFSPHPQSFGHAGMGGALGWADPVSETAFGYVMNRMGWRVRSPRAVALCRALYECDPIRDA